MSYTYANSQTVTERIEKLLARKDLKKFYYITDEGRDYQRSYLALYSRDITSQEPDLYELFDMTDSDKRFVVDDVTTQNTFYWHYHNRYEARGEA